MPVGPNGARGRRRSLPLARSTSGGELIASVAGDGKVSVRNAQTEEHALTLGAQTNDSRALAFGPENRPATATKSNLTVREIPSR